MMIPNTIPITTMVDNNIKKILIKSIVPFVMSVNNKEKFKNGTKESKALLSTLTINAIIPGKKEINVSGVRGALCFFK